MREWMVIRLGRPEDTSKFLPQAVVEEEFTEQDAPRARTTRNAGLGEPNTWATIADAQRNGRAQPARGQRQGRGYYVKPGDRDDKSGSIVHTTEDAAINYAKELAAKNPKVLYGVFTCVRVFETTEPQVIEKSFNDSGELVIESTGATTNE